MPPYMRDLMGAAGPRYDLVGMDPRSLGRSAAVDCGWPPHLAEVGGESRRSFARATAFAQDLARRCARTNADLIPHISTRDIARDMDVVRGALGERKVSYNGASYGTYLGSVYATMFPGRLDRVVLDSSVDPAAWSPRLLAGTERANDHALGAWAAWAADRDGEYGLGASRAEVLGTVRGLVEASAREPSPSAGTGWTTRRCRSSCSTTSAPTRTGPGPSWRSRCASSRRPRAASPPSRPRNWTRNWRSC